MLQTCQWTPKTFQDAMDPLQTRKLSGPHSKSPYTKAGPLLGSQCPVDITGQPFRAIPATVPLFQQSCVLMCHWTTEDLFRITMQCFKSLDTIMVFQQCMSLLNNTMPPTCPWTAGYLL
ncbi:hypothetical protein TNCT_404411 [Trichonephila clavata]|uniref:Uncharacterized protein n=1 Tax=Trichonephila clavata TaxID=2740835 RepID=A0A8X6LUW4_TRICU|nr:hypothetical protein TNCT_404411 [Trichonephila clavata]